MSTSTHHPARMRGHWSVTTRTQTSVPSWPTIWISTSMPSRSASGPPPTGLPLARSPPCKRSSTGWVTPSAQLCGPRAWTRTMATLRSDPSMIVAVVQSTRPICLFRYILHVFHTLYPGLHCFGFHSFSYHAGVLAGLGAYKQFVNSLFPYIDLIHMSLSNIVTVHSNQPYSF